MTTQFKPGDRIIGLAAYPERDGELIEGEFQSENVRSQTLNVRLAQNIPGYSELFPIRSVIARTAQLVPEEDHSSEEIGLGDYEQYDVAAVLAELDEPEVTSRAAVLQEAEKLITGDRNHSYGSPTQNFTNTAEVWTALLRHKLRDGEVVTATEVGTLMIGLKLARTVAQPKRDNFVDIAGYAGCAWETIEEATE